MTATDENGATQPVARKEGSKAARPSGAAERRSVKPGVFFLLAFLLFSMHVTVLQAACPAVEVFFTGAAANAFACGALAGFALGFSRGPKPSWFQALLVTAVACASFYLLPLAYEGMLRLNPGTGLVLFVLLALPAAIAFFFVGMLLAPWSPGCRVTGLSPVLGALLGTGVSRIVYALLVEGRLRLDILLGAILMASLLLLGLRYILAPASRAGRGKATLSAAGPGPGPGGAEDGGGSQGTHRRAPYRWLPIDPGATTFGAFFMGAAVAAVYPVTRKVLLQMTPLTPGTDLILFGSIVFGAVLGVLFPMVVFSSGSSWRRGFALLGTVAFGFGLLLLGRELAFTQNMVEFGGFKRYIGNLRGEYFSFLREEIPLYLALLAIPSFTAGWAMAGLRGAWRAFLFGLAAGILLGAGPLPWTGSSASLVIQACLLAAAAAVFFGGRAVLAGGHFLPVGWRIAVVLGVLGLLWVTVQEVRRFEHHEYPDLPISGEKDLLLFEPSSAHDLRVTTSVDDLATVRIDAGYAFNARGFTEVAELTARLPRILGMQGRCLVVGPLAPFMAPLVTEAIGNPKTSAGQGDAAARSFAALESIPMLEPAHAVVADFVGRATAAPNLASKGRLVAASLLGLEERYENILFLPRYPLIAAARGHLSREVFAIVHDRLADRGVFWLYLDTTHLEAGAATSIAAAFAGTFDKPSLWLVEDGLLPPFLLLLGFRGEGLIGMENAERRLGEVVASVGQIESPIRSVTELAEYLLADPQAMRFIEETFTPASARWPLVPGKLSGEASGWSTVDELLRWLPVSSLRGISGGREIADEEAMRKARRAVLDGQAIHRRYVFDIEDEHDLDWDLFRQEVDAYRRAFEVYPQTAIGRRILASLMPLLINEDELQVAFETITAVAGAEPADPVLRYDLGYVCFLLLDYAEALSHFQAVVAADPSHLDALFYAGICAMGADRKEEALQHFERILELEPDREGLYKHLAICCNDTGRVEDAAVYCAKALAADLDDEELKALKTLIEVGSGQDVEELEPIEMDKKKDDHDHDHDHGGTGDRG